MGKNLKVIIFLTLIFSLFAFVNTSQSIKKEVERNVIEIFDDTDFEKYKFEGNGSKNNPYIIQNFEISYFTDLIHIANTSKYFVIKNNILTSGNKAIFIENIAENTGKIVNNTIQECEDGAIVVSNSKGLEITHNYIYYCYWGIKAVNVSDLKIAENEIYSCFSGFYEGGTGIYLYDGQNVILKKNVIKNNEKFGIVISTSSNISCQENEIVINKQGIFASSSSLLEFLENNFSISNYGIFLDKTIKVQVKSNFFSQNENFAISSLTLNQLNINDNEIKGGQIGCFLRESNKINISFNNIRNNDKAGIQSLNSSDVTIFQNKILKNKLGLLSNSSSEFLVTQNSFIMNKDYAIYLDKYTTNFLIYYNDFINNFPESKSQAHDDGKNNKWYSEDFQIGNYWNPHNNIGRIYNIDGDANSKDIYSTSELIFEENGQYLPDKTSRIPFALGGFIITLLLITEIRKRKKVLLCS